MWFPIYMAFFLFQELRALTKRKRASEPDPPKNSHVSSDSDSESGSDEEVRIS